MLDLFYFMNCNDFFVKSASINVFVMYFDALIVCFNCDKLAFRLPIDTNDYCAHQDKK